jgi:hypothetical protein
MNSHNDPSQSMSSGNVDEFDIRILDARDLVVSVVPIRAPWNAHSESYEVSDTTAQ